jgi:hypothetical protein
MTFSGNDKTLQQISYWISYSSYHFVIRFLKLSINFDELILLLEAKVILAGILFHEIVSIV